MDVRELLVDDPQRAIFRVHRSTMTSPEILAEEWKRIFDRSWLYVGHESEVPAPGDYRRRTVARRPLIFLRNTHGDINVLFNTCTHRGALVCRQDAGNAANFQCFYHAWTFDSDGALVGLPGQEGYPPAFDRLELALQRPARVASHRGMWFVSFDPGIEDLSTWLGPVADQMDLTLEAADVVGGWEALAGSSRFTVKANWKLLVENSVDSYHFPTVHQTYQSYMSKRRAEAGTTADAPKGPGTRGLAFANGHGGFLHTSRGRPLANPTPLWSDDVNAEVLRIRSLLDERFGHERAREMAEGSRHLLIFPNLLFQDSSTGCRIRQIWPVSPDEMEVLQWELAPRDEIPELRASRLDASAVFLGPGGFGSPDDVEALESCQHGFGAVEVGWSDISRGLHREVPRSDEELQMRGFWRAWAAAMAEGVGRHPVSVSQSTDPGREPPEEV
jgi:p-cumate 2,3-dioxygenase alpha subunit